MVRLFGMLKFLSTINLRVYYYYFFYVSVEKLKLLAENSQLSLLG